MEKFTVMTRVPRVRVSTDHDLSGQYYEYIDVVHADSYLDVVAAKYDRDRVPHPHRNFPGARIEMISTADQKSFSVPLSPKNRW